MSIVYVLELEKNKYYVGKTNTLIKGTWSTVPERILPCGQEDISH